LRIFQISAVNKVHTAPWPHCPNRNFFNDRRNSLYDKSASFRCDGRLFHSPGPAAENALSPKVLYVRVHTQYYYSTYGSLVNVAVNFRTLVITGDVELTHLRINCN